ncbi:MAG: hypothetical protein NT174_03340, partial [Actinobacteria bacterium]|nr:hypothetical protein [Actinomycetota bacterium]
MRIRILLTSVIVAGLTLSTVQGAFAAIKPGSACKKAGQVALDSKKVYTCVKSGKKLIWNKGAAIPGGVVGALPTQSQPAPTTTTQPAPSVPKPPAIGTSANPVAAGTKVTIGKVAFRLEGTNNSVMAQVCA